MRASQKDTILKWLKTNNDITSIEAFEHFKITRLSSIINILRKEGYDIESRRPKKGNYAIYMFHGTKYETHHIEENNKKQEQLGLDVKSKKRYKWPD